MDNFSKGRERLYLWVFAGDLTVKALAIILYTMNKKKELTITEFARMGAEAVKRKYPKSHYIQMGKKGALKRWGKKRKKRSSRIQKSAKA